MPSAEAAYLFRHAMMRLAAYELQPLTSRSELHGYAFAIIEQLPDAEHLVFELADHAHFASLSQPDPRRRQEMLERESRWLPRAMEKARLGSNFRLALEYAQRLMDLTAADITTRHNAALQAAEMSAMLGDFEAPPLLLQQAERIAARADDPKLEANRILCRVATVYMPGRRFHDALTELPKARDIYRTGGDRLGEARTLGYLGNLTSAVEQREHSLKHYEEAETLFRAMKHLRGVSTCRGNEGLVHKHQGRFEQAEACYREALEIDREVGNREGIPRHLGNLGVLYRDQGNFHKALDLFAEADDLFRELGDRPSTMRNYMNYADCHERMGQSHRAISLYQTAQRISEECGLGYNRACNIHYRGLALLKMNDQVRGEPVVEEAALAFASVGAHADATECWADLAKSAFKRGEYADQLRWSESGLAARAKAGEAVARDTSFRLLSLHAQAALAHSSFGPAAASASEALAIAPEGCDPILRSTLKAIVDRGQASAAT
ncbi:MAG: tetratricopeptide repeat protein [Planctomycetes bacterium]|nr:tetratricopeptide repeat protein [Planctomycetota bacterium]